MKSTKPSSLLGLCAGLFAVCWPATGHPEKPRLPVPDKLVVLAFDDGNASDLATVAPILEKHGFGATFFITSGWLGGEKRLGWSEVVKLHEAGFEIGCHSTTHPNLLGLSTPEIEKQIVDCARACAANGVPKATSFAYPGGHFDRRVIAAMEKHGYRTARRGRDPERPLEDAGGLGRAYVPGEDDPFLIPSTMTRGVGAMEDAYIVRALAQATAGRIAVLTYHGVPDVHRHCSTPIERFRKDMRYLEDSGATVIAVRDLVRYVDLSKRPADPFAPIVRRLGMRVESPRCDTTQAVPKFSWKLDPNRWKQKQVAYRILVASTRKQLERDRGDLWESGKVTSGNRSNVPYEGKALEAGRTYWWKVQCWNRRDPAAIAEIEPYQSEELLAELQKSRAGPFSSPASFKANGTKQRTPGR